MATTEEKLVLEGGKVKVLCAKRQLYAKSQNGIIVDYFRFTIKRENIHLHQLLEEKERLIEVLMKKEKTSKDESKE